MINRRSRLYRFMIYFATALLLHLIAAQQMAQATDYSGYEGTSHSGRPSWLTVDCPGGVKVNTFLGNLFLPRLDLRIPGRGLPIEIALSYNGDQANLPGSFGNGWHFSYQITAARNPDDTIVIAWGDGRRDLFAFSGGVYTPVNEGMHATLAQVGTNQLCLTTEKHVQYFFALPARSASSSVQQMQDPDGNSLTFTYDSSGELTAITDAPGRNIFLNYTQGHVTSITDPNSTPARTLRYVYDSQGNQVRFTDALGQQTSYAYDGTHRLKQITDPLGLTNIYYGGPNGAVSQVSRLNPSGLPLSSRSFTYDTTANTTTMTDKVSSGKTETTRYVYDSNNRLTGIRDPLEHIQARTYDSAGNVASVTDTNGHTAQFTYDAAGNLLTVTDANGHTTTFTYEPVFNRVTSVTDPLGRMTTYNYDGRGHLTSIQDPQGNTTQNSYDGFGQLISRQDARGLTTTFTYDSNGDRTSITDSLNRTTTFSYDGVGNIVSTTNARNNTTTYHYDARNRVTGVTYSDGTSAAFNYDAANNLLSATDANSSLSYAYDGNGRLIQATDNLLGKTNSYQYDGVGNRTQMIDSAGAVTTYGYDRYNHLQTITRNGQQFLYTYDNGGRRTQLTLPNGSYTRYAYDAANELLSVSNYRSDNSVLSSFAYQYDAAGNRTQLTLADGEQIAYSYDNDNRLIHEVRTGGSSNYDHQFVYDAVGNRIQQNADGAITSYNYDNANELTKQTTGSTLTSYDYDANGNQIDRISGSSTSTYQYDVRDRLIATGSPTASASYAYDALDRRITKSVGGTTTRFVYDGQNVAAEYDGVGTLQAQYLTGAGIDQGLAKYAGGASYYYLRDGLNSVRNVIDATQTVQNSYDYDAWGAIRSQVENVPDDYTFTGRQVDRESGIYYFRARMYDASTGRFTQVDPVASDARNNLYSYGGNDPVNHIDPLGTSWFGSLVGAIAGAVAVAAAVAVAVVVVGAAVVAAAAVVGAAATAVAAVAGAAAATAVATTVATAVTAIASYEADIFVVTTVVAIAAESAPYIGGPFTDKVGTWIDDIYDPVYNWVSNAADASMGSNSSSSTGSDGPYDDGTSGGRI